MKDKFDEMLREALIQYYEEEFVNIPSEDEIEVEFSERHIKRMNDMIKNFDKVVAGTYEFPEA